MNTISNVAAKFCDKYCTLYFTITSTSTSSTTATTTRRSVGFEFHRGRYEEFFFWDITSCSPLEVNRRFDGIFRLQLQGVRISQARNEHETGISDDGVVLTACFMLVSCSAYYSTLKMEATRFSVTSVDFQRTTLRYIAEDRTHNNNNANNTHYHHCTEPCSGATNSPASCSAGAGFEYVPRDRISCLWMYSGFPQSLQTNVKLDFKISHSRLLSHILNSLVVII
jgi:hypothetical protein